MIELPLHMLKLDMNSQKILVVNLKSFESKSIKYFSMLIYFMHLVKELS